MSPHPDESGIVPDDDRLLVRPYVAPPGRPSSSTAPEWPRTGSPVSSFAPEPASAPAAVPGPASGRASGPGSASAGRAGAHRKRARRSRPPVAVLALLGLGAAGGLVFLLTGSEDPEPDRAMAPPGLSVPELQARDPGAGEPSPAVSAPRSGAASASPGASASASVSPGPSTSANQGEASGAPSGGSGKTSADGSGTLRPGDRGPEVRDLQQRLVGQGFTYVNVNGVYDGQTRRGVAQLQSDRGITGDPKGVYGPATQAAFGAGG
ncbi:peptidoglycan-binding protein [Streptomyces sp. APSN-46.1]|uniref:peptidoglycan-binding domain-containing protein n=1 Tax=Streptomyces sp. APSN-46.1 TaxID=2929049 RepID=UPI001FB44BC3|nr:peptidoglycan-binding domain-containing protein [Streptomyces sp. APSN-46.1]MCJ1676734.1 peptidoglycan-binding protein [Streptomyces sp. APSN-46.1]